MSNRIFVSLYLLITLFGFSFAQAQGNKQYLYEVSSDPWWKSSTEFVWRSSTNKHTTVSLNGSNYQIYNFGDFTSLFDTNSFAFSDNTKGGSFDPKIKTDRNSSDVQTWKTSFETPPTSTMTCYQNLSADMTYETTSTEKFEVIFKGEKKLLEVKKVVGSAFVNACGYSASMKSVTHYWEQGGILVSQEWVSFYNGAIRSGRKILLKEINISE